MASATMQAHQHQLDTGNQVIRPESHLAMELSGPQNSAYLQQHSNQQFSQHHGHPLVQVQEHNVHQNRHYNSASQFYNTEHSARAVVSAAMSAHLEQRRPQADHLELEAGEQFYYQHQQHQHQVQVQAQQGSSNPESVYQHLYGGVTNNLINSEQNNNYSLAGVSPANSTNYASNHHYELTNSSNNQLAADAQQYPVSQHSYNPFIQSFNRASTDSSYQSYSNYIGNQSSEQQQLQLQLNQTDTHYRQLSLEANRGLASIGDSDQSR